ncbi:hypothetical protein CCP3SC15_400005 [Gammaproteobacteria bacterium]
MTQTIQEVITAAQAAILIAVTKIQSAPDYALETRIAVPSSLAFGDNVRMILNPGGYYVTLFDLQIGVVIPQGNQESAAHWLADIPQSIGNVFRADPTISGTAQTYEGDVTAHRLKDDSINGIGYVFTVQNVKIFG